MIKQKKKIKKIKNQEINSENKNKDLIKQAKIGTIINEKRE